MYCWNCESEFNFSQVKVKITPYNSNNFLCPYCRSKNIEEVVEDFILKNTNGEEVDYFGTEEEALKEKKNYHEKLKVVRVLTGMDSGDSIEQEL